MLIQGACVSGKPSVGHRTVSLPDYTGAMRTTTNTSLPRLLSGLCLAGLLTWMPAAAQAPESPAPRRPDAPALALPGPHPVGVTTVSMTHPAQLDPLNPTAGESGPARKDRTLTIELWYPARCCTDGVTEYEDVLGSGPGNAQRPLRPFRIQGRATRNAAPDPATDPAPLVVLSHGYPGSRVLMSYLGEHLASRGYLVAAIDHANATHADRDEFASTLFHHPRDIVFVIDELLVGGGSGQRLAFADPERTAIIGYSMGGYGALVAAGAGVAREVADSNFVTHGAMRKHAEGAVSADARIRAVIALAPWGAPAALQAAGIEDVESLWRSSALSDIAAPVLYIAGDADRVSGYEGGVRWLWQQGHGAERWLLTYHQARHNVAPMPPPLASRSYPREFAHYAEPVWDIERLNDLNRHFITAFLGVYLRADESYAEHLQPWLNGDRQTLPGFAPGTAIGFSLERD